MLVVSCLGFFGFVFLWFLFVCLFCVFVVVLDFYLPLESSSLDFDL